MSMARTTPAQKPRGFNSSTRLVTRLASGAASFRSRSEETGAIVVTILVYRASPTATPAGYPPGCPLSPRQTPTPPPAFRRRRRASLDGVPNSKTPPRPPPSTHSPLWLFKGKALALSGENSSFRVTALMPAMAAEGGHPLCVLAMRGAVLLPRGSHTIAGHVSAFGRCSRHKVLLQVIQLRCSRSTEHLTRSLEALDR